MSGRQNVDTARLIAVARGEREPDLVVENGRVFSAFTREWLDGVQVAVAEGRIAGIGPSYDGGTRVDAAGGHVVPGLIDAHVHIESSKMRVEEFARSVLARGTTAVVADPHEIANVLGTDGIHWLLDVCDRVPLDVYVMAPSCVPASSFESPRRAMSVGDMESILRRRQALGVGEMMNFPGVIAGDESELAKLRVRGASHVDGHAPGVRGASLDAYLAAGIRSDHESTTVEEALEKRRKGMWVLLREASNARNLVDLLPLIAQYGPENCAFCTDDREPDFLVREGHMDQMCRLAVANGIAAEDALLMASLHPARYHRLEHAGVLGPGYQADFAILDDLKEFQARAVYKSGELVARDGEAVDFATEAIPLWVRRSVRMQPVDARTFQRGCESDGSPVRVIGIIPGQLLTDPLTETPLVVDGHAVADPERDMAKIAVVERHHATGQVGAGFVRGFTLTRGAFASTVAHDAHNVVIVGTDDADMAACATRLEQIGGGIVVVDAGEVVAELPLPIAGLMSDLPAHEVVARSDQVNAALRELGVQIDAPFMTLSFLALSVIPSLKITDQGLVDVDSFQLVPLAAGVPAAAL